MAQPGRTPSPYPANSAPQQQPQLQYNAAGQPQYLQPTSASLQYQQQQQQRPNGLAVLAQGLMQGQQPGTANAQPGGQNSQQQYPLQQQQQQQQQQVGAPPQAQYIVPGQPVSRPPSAQGQPAQGFPAQWGGPSAGQQRLGSWPQNGARPSSAGGHYPGGLQQPAAGQVPRQQQQQPNGSAGMYASQQQQQQPSSAAPQVATLQASNLIPAAGAPQQPQHLSAVDQAAVLQRQAQLGQRSTSGQLPFPGAPAQLPQQQQPQQYQAGRPGSGMGAGPGPQSAAAAQMRPGLPQPASSQGLPAQQAGVPAQGVPQSAPMQQGQAQQQQQQQQGKGSPFPDYLTHPNFLILPQEQRRKRLWADLHMRPDFKDRPETDQHKALQQMMAYTDQKAQEYEAKRQQAQPGLARTASGGLAAAGRGMAPGQQAMQGIVRPGQAGVPGSQPVPRTLPASSSSGQLQQMGQPQSGAMTTAGLPVSGALGAAMLRPNTPTYTPQQQAILAQMTPAQREAVLKRNAEMAKLQARAPPAKKPATAASKVEPARPGMAQQQQPPVWPGQPGTTAAQPAYGAGQQWAPQGQPGQVGAMYQRPPGAPYTQQQLQHGRPQLPTPAVAGRPPGSTYSAAPARPAATAAQQAAAAAAAAMTPLQRQLSTIQKPAAEEDRRMLPRRALQRILRQAAGPGANPRLAPEVEQAMLELAEDFLERALTFGLSMARRRRSHTLEPADISVYLERNWQLFIPGFSGDTFRATLRPGANPVHRARQAAVRRSVAAASTEAGGAANQASTAAGPSTAAAGGQAAGGQNAGAAIVLS